MGGVGKTTLVKEVFRQAKKGFDDVVLVLDVKKNPDMERIQKEIMEQLGMDVNGSQTMVGRASDVCGRIKDKKVFVILDDVWEKIDLEALGLPQVATCKILMTSRGRDVLSSMGTQKEFIVGELDAKESWSLFEKMAGDVVKDQTIQKVAIEVAEKCGGLPVLIVTVARALKNKASLHPWKDALRRLRVFDKEEITEKAFGGLEWSYNQLEEEELKPLFLLCGLLRSNNSINLEDLLKYSMGLGLFNKIDTVEETRHALHSSVEKLKDSCLLLDNNDNEEFARIHDLVRDVANRIAYRDQHVLTLARGDELKELPDKKCTKIYLPYCVLPKFPEVLECPKLKMFFLGNKDERELEIPCNFFQEMKELTVLDLTKLHMASSLPPSLQVLKSLRTLCLDCCELGNIALVGQLTNLEILSFIYSKFKQLPEEIGNLTRLRLLDLTECSKLEIISPNVISNLQSLEDLRMRNSFTQWEAEEEVTGERRNARLLELKQLSRLASLDICIPDANMLPADLFSSNKLERYRILIGRAWYWYGVDGTLNTLKLEFTASNQQDQGLNMLMKKSEDLWLSDVRQLDSDVFQLVTEEESREIMTEPLQVFMSGQFGMPNLRSLTVDRCNRLRFFFSSSMAQSLQQLKHLRISGCEIMEEIVSMKSHGEENMDIQLFPKLQTLKLEDLPKLARFCSGSYIDFPSLERLELIGCTELGAFISRSDPISENITVKKEIEEGESKEKFERVEHYFLFDEKVGFPCLNRLLVEGSTKLKTIWHHQLAPNSSFCKLTSVWVENCHTLVNIFPSSMMGRLNNLTNLKIGYCNSLDAVFELKGINLKESHHSSATELKTFHCPNLTALSIWNCESLKSVFPASVIRGLQKLDRLLVGDCGVEEIVANDEIQEKKPKLFVFPKATYVSFLNLRNLKSFYPGMHASNWPLLKTLEVQGCERVETLDTEMPSFKEKLDSDGLDSPPKQSLFFVDKGSFPNLETLELETLSKSTVFHQKYLPNLVTLCLIRAPLQEIFVHEEENSSNGEIHAVRMTLPNLKSLELREMHRLMHLENEPSARARSVFSTSFRNLTILKVGHCRGLSFLTTYAVAKSLTQLKGLKVRNCTRMTDLVASNGDGTTRSNVITFSQLQLVELSYLPILKGFCLGNCTVEFPALKTLRVTKCPELKISPELEMLQTTVPGAYELEKEFYGFDYWCNQVPHDENGQTQESIPSGKPPAPNSGKAELSVTVTAETDQQPQYGSNRTQPSIATNEVETTTPNPHINVNASSERMEEDVVVHRGKDREKATTDKTTQQGSCIIDETTEERAEICVKTLQESATSTQQKKHKEVTEKISRSLQVLSPPLSGSNPSTPIAPMLERTGSPFEVHKASTMVKVWEEDTGQSRPVSTLSGPMESIDYLQKNQIIPLELGEAAKDCLQDLKSSADAYTSYSSKAEDYKTSLQKLTEAKQVLENNIEECQSFHTEVEASDAILVGLVQQLVEEKQKNAQLRQKLDAKQEVSRGLIDKFGL